MTKPMIQVESLSKRYRLGQRAPYGRLTEAVMKTVTAPARVLMPKRDRAAEEDLWALKDVSFEIAQGEVVGIIGRNGAGKSTLLKILSRITEPTAGRALLRGRVGSLLEVGTGFHPELTGRENVYLNGAILGMRRQEIRKKFDEIVAFAELEKFLDTPVKRYSSGMYMRLAFAVAAHLDPEILLVDEVLSVGDMAFQKRCLGKMESVASSGRTVLFVSHNMAAVRSLTTRVIGLDSGRVAIIDTPDVAVQWYSGLLESRNETELLFESKGKPIEIAACKLQPEPDWPTFDVCSRIHFTVEVNCNQSLSNAYLGISIINQTSDCVLFLRDIEADRTLTDSRPAGRYRYDVSIPPSTLSPGRYEIDLATAARHGGAIDWPQNRLQFTVEDRSSSRRQMGLPWKGICAAPMELSCTHTPK